MAVAWTAKINNKAELRVLYTFISTPGKSKGCKAMDFLLETEKERGKSTGYYFVCKTYGMTL
jgi:hypothetical protein